MLLFSTVLDIKKSLTHEAFIQLVIDWNNTSKYAENTVRGIDWQGERNVRWGDEHHWLAIEEYRDEDIIAVRYEKVEADGTIWDTDYVMNFRERKMAVRLERSIPANSLTFDREFSNPHFISLLIDNGYVEYDGPLPVLHAPVEVDFENLDLVVDVLNGRLTCELPIVYVSKTFLNENPLSVGLLMSKLKGVAHILVQKDSESNPALYERCDCRNEICGAIGVYHTSPELKVKSFPAQPEKELFDAVLRYVVQTNNERQVEPLYTWLGVNNALLSARLASQRQKRFDAEKSLREAVEKLASGDSENASVSKEDVDGLRSEINDWIASYEELEKKNEDLIRENQRLQSDNLWMTQERNRQKETPILCAGDEKEFFPGEIKDMLLSFLVDNLPSENDAEYDHRRTHIVSDLIEHNNYEHLAEARKKELKALMDSYTGLTPVFRKKLEALGLVLHSEEKHYKFHYYNDERYALTIPKTPSDGRGGKNATSGKSLKFL